MAYNSHIEWTQATWNPVTGCSKISVGCKNCYAEKFAIRLKAMGHPHYANGFKVTLHPDALTIPLHWKKPRIIFVNSMSDLFHEDVPIDFIQRVFETMTTANWHIYQVLTKRSQRMLELSPQFPWTPNIWLGVTVETQEYIYRIEHLKKTPAHIKFISFEPLLSDMPNLDLNGINWVIVGGESGPGARPMKPEWVINILRQCQAKNIPFFFKQWGGKNKKKAGRTLLGRTWNQMPRRATL